MENESKPSRGLAGLRVLSLESRRAQEMSKLIANYGGEPIVAPSMREVPLESNADAIAFAHALMSGRFDVVILLTGVGTRALSRVVETVYSKEEYVTALRRCALVARGPKPVAALKEMGLQPIVTAPEPNTWRELLQALDAAVTMVPLSGSRVAVQEYGSSNPELLSALAQRGATVVPVPVYEWDLPQDIAPLKAAVKALVEGKIDVALFTTSIQVTNLLRIAAELQLEETVHKALAKIVVGSIGPTTSETLREHGIRPDFEPEHPKMGFLVNAAAERTAALLAEKRQAVQ
jgi:uroporphyrinogen-III synthase